MDEIAPDVRGRIAFAALLASLYLIAAERSLAAADISAIYLVAPAVAVIAVGHSLGREALFRAGISVAVLATTALIVRLAHGQAAPSIQNTTLLIYALSGIFALNLVIIVVTSLILRGLWPTSDNWTR